MTYITEKDENDLDNNHKVFITRGKQKFKLEQSNVICYGRIDFNKNSDDYYQLEEIIPFNKVVHIPIDYDLATHCCMSPIKSYRTTECSNISEICRYNYGVLGKPDRVAIFKTRIK